MMLGFLILLDHLTKCCTNMDKYIVVRKAGRFYDIFQGLGWEQHTRVTVEPNKVVKYDSGIRLPIKFLHHIMETYGPFNKKFVEKPYAHVKGLV